MTVILAEKPSQAKAYADAFSNVKRGDGFYLVPSCDVFKDGAKITWGIGHLVTLKEPHEYVEDWKKWSLKSLPIVPETFQFKVADDKRKQFNIVKALLKEAQEIIIATDCDREGENIARSIISLSNCQDKPVKRLWINSLEEEEVVRGFQHLRNGDDYLPLYHEAQARQISDWIVGLNGSRLYTLVLQKLGSKEVFSVGRVQTPTLKLIYERQKEIETFKPMTFFELEAEFKAEGIKFKGKNKERYSSKDEAEEFLNNQGLQDMAVEGVVQQVTTKQKKENPPKLHSLSSLQTLANKKYKYSPSDVLRIVQELYDTPLKLVTYPRTDTHFITENEFAYLQANFRKYQQLTGDQFVPSSLEANKRYVDNQKVKEHYAIVPTKKIPDEATLGRLSVEQKNIYFEIIKSVLAMFHAPYEYDETMIEISVNGILFVTKGKVEKVLGWKELFQTSEDEDEHTTSEEKESSTLPKLSEGESCKGDLQIKEGVTTAPKRYTEGQLINLMKTSGKFVDASNKEAKTILNEIEGLGTEATRSGIIETLKSQKYIEVTKNLVYVTKKGSTLCEIVEGTMLAKPDLTAEWESYLKKIGMMQGEKDTFISQTIQFTHQLVDSVHKLLESSKIDLSDGVEQTGIAPCPTCKKGKIIEHSKFYGCTSYKDGCTQTFPKRILEKDITKAQIQQLCSKGKSGKIKGFKGKKGKFDACLVLNEGKISFSFGK